MTADIDERQHLASRMTVLIRTLLPLTEYTLLMLLTLLKTSYESYDSSRPELFNDF